MRRERASVTRSRVAQQAHIGYSGRGVASLRSEAWTNNGPSSMHQQIVGNVAVQQVQIFENEDTQATGESPFLQEGLDDVVNRQSVPRQRTTTGVQRHNIHLDRSFDATKNDPSVRFGHITAGYQSLHSLSNSIQQFITAQHAPPPCGVLDIVQDFNRISPLLQRQMNLTYLSTDLHWNDFVLY